MPLLKCGQNTSNWTKWPFQILPWVKDSVWLIKCRLLVRKILLIFPWAPDLESTHVLDKMTKPILSYHPALPSSDDFSLVPQLPLVPADCFCWPLIIWFDARISKNAPKPIRNLRSPSKGQRSYTTLGTAWTLMAQLSPLTRSTITANDLRQNLALLPNNTGIFFCYYEPFSGCTMINEKQFA